MHSQLKSPTCLFNARPVCTTFTMARAICSSNLLLQLRVTKPVVCSLPCVWLCCTAGVLCKKPTCKHLLRGVLQQSHLSAYQARFGKRDKITRGTVSGRNSRTPELPSPDPLRFAESHLRTTGLYYYLHWEIWLPGNAVWYRVKPTSKGP